ncbi:hypothetical protein BZA05DRAFT_19859 [Tricharina praecox]|uniref:uncharacterized protein n=1 Tax=Tricharina praecox TaxID=43433 RepID=UPI00221F5001|nr:uncharacterized protein BZA05DRAFT_19859 [Tricharina praecox]KAI5859017.1 hypothetical protein BZA05DRAFT_19859 [Tricharina praecox]
MPRRHFTADLQRLSASGALGPHITGVKRGDDDGTFQFIFNAHRPGVVGVEICGTIPELADYPSSHQMFMYIGSPDPPTFASDALLDLDVNFHDLEKAIAKISEKLLKSLDAADNDGGNHEDMDDSDGLEDSDFGSVGGGWSDDELTTALDGHTPMTNPGSMSSETKSKRSKLLKELRDDLRQAKSAGFKVGVLGDYAGGISFFVSISVRIEKLGISDEALIAWKLDKMQYFIVLIHYSNYYQNTNKLVADSVMYHARQNVDLCVGTCANYKPTLQEAITAFSKVTAGKTQYTGNLDGSDPDYDVLRDNIGREGAFQGIFISGPLNQLLNTALLPLLKCRMRYAFGWDGAELYYNCQRGKDTDNADEIDQKFYTDQPPKQTLVPLVMADALSDASASFTPAGSTTAGFTTASFPLLAMQFSLRHLVRCTEFCLVCHNKVLTDFEALKPYVCSSPLCLYQYMSLGFGPSIEYEIMSQPTVVDLLVNFCYASARGGKLANFPDGMDLKIYSSASPQYSGDFHRTKNEFRFPIKGPVDLRPLLKDGGWIVMTVAGIGGEEWHARIIETCYWPVVKISPPINVRALTVNSGDLQSTETSSDVPPPSYIPGATDVRDVQFKIYDDAFDSVNEHEKRKAIVNLLNTLPSVSEMKAWLQRSSVSGGEVSLRKFKNRLSPSAMGLLRWIIASNRSCIVPLDDSDESTSSGFMPVQGMGPEWKQFRFAMGAPDKEQRFVNSVKEAQKRIGSKYPSLFAFHGSPIANWHSIIREGLNFKQTLHGRAFGHGCYHSLDLTTSLNYSMNNMNHGSGISTALSVGTMTWPQSELQITNALSLNEIVNSPNEFVSKAPHLVVAQLDWIQTRYLFVLVQKPLTKAETVVNAMLLQKSGTTITAVMSAKSTAEESKKQNVLPRSMIHPQDPNFTPRNGNTALVIPATPSSRRREVSPSDDDIVMVDAPPPHTPRKRKMKQENGKGIFQFVNRLTGGSSVDDPLTDDHLADDDSASTATDDEDLRVLLSDEEDSELEKGKGKKKFRPDEFIPDSLDTSMIEFLAPPSYASPMASKRLNSDIRSLIRLQESTPLHELGFYLNPKYVENVYQWIIEMHSFPENIPLVKDMRSKSPVVRSIVFEIRFGPQYPMSPPFVRVVQPRFKGFHQGGGGNVTLGGAMCMELLTNTGWSAVSTVESVLMQVRMALMDEERPARLEQGPVRSYSVSEAVEAFKRACRAHGWKMPDDINMFR